MIFIVHCNMQFLVHSLVAGELLAAEEKRLWPSPRGRFSQVSKHPA